VQEDKTSKGLEVNRYRKYRTGFKALIQSIWKRNTIFQKDKILTTIGRALSTKNI
jgi:hypothetical protein